MACLIDTGILLRVFDKSSTEYPQIRQSFSTLRSRQERVVVTLQNLAEFWNVSTRPIDKNGYGLSPERVSRRMKLIERICEVGAEDDHSFRIWKDLLIVNSITGVSVHDARLVSVMRARGITQILTLNGRDFSRYDRVTAVAPGQLRSRTRPPAPTPN